VFLPLDSEKYNETLIINPNNNLYFISNNTEFTYLNTYINKIHDVNPEIPKIDMKKRYHIKILDNLDLDKEIRYFHMKYTGGDIKYKSNKGYDLS